ncbi:hypothetical protein DV736_g962, partial [Chaetothyriales sp. CBS 134916]
MSGPKGSNTTTVLTKPQDWDEWLYLIRQTAEESETWCLVDPALDNEPNQPSNPSKPGQPADDADENTIHLYRLKWDRYKVQLRNYEQQRKGLQQIKPLILGTIDRRYLAYLKDYNNSYQILTALRKRITR